MNIFDINTIENYMIIAVTEKVGLIPFNALKNNNIDLLGKIKYILHCNDQINQIKLMKNPHDDSFYILALENRP